LAATACQSQALARLGHTDRARDALDAALAQANDSARETPAIRSWAAGIAAELAAAAGDHASAEARFREALALAGETHYPRIAYAQYLLERQRPQDALRLLATAPDDGSVMRLRRQALEMSP
jgi:predicted Zn-dependent protease